MDFAAKYRNAPTDLLRAKLEALTVDARLLVSLFNQKNLTALDVLRTEFRAVTTYALYFEIDAVEPHSEKELKDLINKFSPNVCAEKNFLQDEINRRAAL